MDPDLQRYILVSITFVAIFFSFLGVVVFTSVSTFPQEMRQRFVASAQKKVDGAMFNLTLETYRPWFGNSLVRANVSISLEAHDNEIKVIRAERATLIIKYVMEDVEERYNTTFGKDLMIEHKVFAQFEIFVKGEPLSIRIVELTERFEVFVESDTSEAMRLVEYSSTFPLEAPIYLPNIIHSLIGVDVNGSLTIPVTVFVATVLALGVLESFGTLYWSRYKAKAYAKEFRKQFENGLSKHKLANAKSVDNKDKMA